CVGRGVREGDGLPARHDGGGALRAGDAVGSSVPVIELERCRSCGASIVWAFTASGKRMPVDADPDERGNLEIRSEEGTMFVDVVEPGAGTHRPHFATCPESNSWQR